MQLPGVSMELQVLPIHSSIPPSVCPPFTLEDLLCKGTLLDAMVHVVVVVQLLSRVQLLRPHGLQPARLLCPQDSPGKNTGVGCHFLLQGIFPAQELNLGLLHCRQILYQLIQKGSPMVHVKNYKTGSSYLQKEVMI